VRLLFLSTAAVLLAIGGCRSMPRQAVLPSKYQLQADQLLVNSDFVLSPDHRLMRDLTSERNDICQTLGLPPGNEPIEVYLFRDAESYAQFLLRHFPSVPSRRAFFLETDTRLTVYAHWSDRVAEDLRHEVAHGYLHAVAPGLPLWLDEGIAEYFEVPRGTNGMNRPHVDLLADMMQHDGWRPDLVRLEQLSDAAEMDQRHYAEAWAWVYFLLHSDPQTTQMLTEYLTDVRAHGRVEPLSARLGTKYAEPASTLAEYLTDLNGEVVASKNNGVQIAK
jgi:uncharacterized protein DUF1570